MTTTPLKSSCPSVPPLLPPLPPVAATTARPMLIRVFFWFLLKWYLLQIPVTLQWLWLLETIDDGEGRGDGGGIGGAIVDGGDNDGGGRGG